MHLTFTKVQSLHVVLSMQTLQNLPLCWLSARPKQQNTLVGNFYSSEGGKLDLGGLMRWLKFSYSGSK